MVDSKREAENGRGKRGGKGVGEERRKRKWRKRRATEKNVIEEGQRRGKRGGK